MTKLRTLSDIQKEFDKKFKDCGHNACPYGEPLPTKDKLFSFISQSLRQLLEQVELKEYDTEGTLLDVNREQYEDGYNTASQQIKEIINEILK